MSEGLWGRIRSGLTRARQGVVGRIAAAISGHRTIDADLLEEIEGILLGADVGMPETARLVGVLREQARTSGLAPEGVRAALEAEVARTLAGAGRPLGRAPAPPTVILMVGVNGSGKTTTAAKLAHVLRGEGRSVLLGAADTFRAAAAEQLAVWADRVGVDLVRHAAGGDPAAVIYDAVSAARARGVDTVICDTAGRLHNKANLMAELHKMVRVAGNACPGAPHEVLLVMDGSTGQNALVQARVFAESAHVTGLVVTKLDTSARGGIVLAVRRELELPVLFLGVGEGLADLRPFDAEAYAAGLLGGEAQDA